MSRAQTRLLALRSDVARQEIALRHAFTDFSTATRSVANPRRLIRERPFACVLGALAFGLWLGGRTRRQLRR